MRKQICMALMAATFSTAQAQRVAESCDGPGIWEEGAERIQGMLLLDLDDHTNPTELAREYGVELEFVSIHSIPDQLMIARLPEESLQATLRALQQDPRVTAASPNYVCQLYSDSDSKPVAATGQQKAPNDPLYKVQWNFHMLHSEQAWKKNAGRDVRVATVDTGLAYWNGQGHHRIEDLADTKVLEGYDFVRGQVEAWDEQGQGTHMAGTIAQTTNNGLGAAGLAYQAQLMPFKVLDGKGRGTFANVAAAIRLASDRQAQIIVLGLGGPRGSDVLHESVKYARSRGSLIIAATGVKPNQEVPYPAAYPEVLAISAVDYKGKLTSYTTRGPNIDLAAPGGQHRQTDYSGIVQNTIRQGNPESSGYFQWSGTSMAAAHVAGVAALVASNGVNGPDAIESVLKETAQSKGAKGQKEGYGAGIVDAGRAVAKAQRVAAYQRIQEQIPLGLLLAGLVGMSLSRRRKVCS